MNTYKGTDKYIALSGMNTYKPHRFPSDIVSHAVWLYFRFNLSHRRCAGPFIEDLLAERGIVVSREAIRLWYPKHSLRSWGRLCIKFGALYARRLKRMYARRLKRKHRGYGDTFFIDEVATRVRERGMQKFKSIRHLLVTINVRKERRAVERMTLCR